MSEIAPETVGQLARQARLALSSEEIDFFTAQLASVLATAKAVQRIETEGVSPTFHAVSVKNVMRADKSRPSWPQELILQNAPDRQEDFFRVPRILEG